MPGIAPLAEAPARWAAWAAASIALRASSWRWRELAASASKAACCAGVSSRPATNAVRSSSMPVPPPRAAPAPAAAVPLADWSAGLKRSAALAALSTSSRRLTSISALTVRPGSRVPSALSTVTTTG